MLLAIDIGNSTTKFGIFDGSDLLDRFSIPTAQNYSIEELEFGRLLRPAGRFLGIDRVIVSSVVPGFDKMIGQAIRKNLNVEPRFVDHTFDFGLKLKYEPPEAAGIDRLINASAAARKYGVPVIACSFGTATTFDLVTRDMEYAGGAIAPGLRMMAEALYRGTAKLPPVSVDEPKSPIGTTTEDSIRSGVYFGYVGLVKGILEKLLNELDTKPVIIGTGGFAGVAAKHVSMINTIDDSLTLDGLRMLSDAQNVEPHQATL